MKPCLSLSTGSMRPATEGDYGSFAALLRNREIRRYLCDDKVMSDKTLAAMLRRSEKLDPHGLGLWVIESDQDEFVGIVGLEPASPEVGAAAETANGIEVTIAIQPSHSGKGLAFESLKAIARYAPDTLGLGRIVAAVDRPNERSHRLVSRCGFRRVGRADGPANVMVLYELSFGSCEDELRAAPRSDC